MKNHALGIPNTATILQNGANKSPICFFFYIQRILIKISSQETRVLFALLHMLLIYVFKVIVQDHGFER